MRAVLLAAAAVSLMVVSGCDDGPQRQPGTAAPAGVPAPSAPARTPTPSRTATGTPDRPTGAATTGAHGPTAPVGAATPGRCRARQLTGDIEQYVRPGQAGASQIARVRLTNTGSRCTMSGYIGIQLLDANGRPRETKLVRTGDAQERLTLDRGQSAWTLIDWMTTPGPDEDDSTPLCRPRPTAALVTPPGVTGAIHIDEDFRTVCRHGEIYLAPVSRTRPN